MSLPTTKKDKTNFYQSFFEDEISEPLVKQEPTNVAIQNLDEGFVKKLGTKIFSNVFILAGAWFLFLSSSILFYNVILKGFYGNTGSQAFFFIGGLILLFLKLGKAKRKKDLLLYSIIPVIGCVFGFLYNLIPSDRLAGDTFANLLMLTYPLVLFVFYYIKGRDNSHNE